MSSESLSPQPALWGLPRGPIDSAGGGAGRISGWLGYDGTRDGTNTIIESAAVESSNSIQCIRAVRLTDSKFAVLYRLDAGSGAGAIQLAICSVSGSAITVGTPVTVAANGAQKQALNISMVTSSKVLVTYSDQTNGQIAKTYTISGNTPTLNATLVVSAYAGGSSALQCFNALAISSTRAICTFTDGGGTDTNKLVIGLTIGSGTLTKDASSTLFNTGVGVGGAISLASSGTNKVVAVVSFATSTFSPIEFTDGNPVTAGAFNPLPAVSFLASGSSGMSLSRVVGNATLDKFFVNSGGNSQGGCFTAFGLTAGTFTLPVSGSQSVGNGEMAGFKGNGVAWMETIDGVDYGLIINLNKWNGKIRIQSWSVDDVTSPHLGGAADNVGASDNQSGMDIIRLNTNQAIAIFPDTLTYPVARVVQL